MRALALLLLATGCVRGTVDRFTTQRVIPRALAVGDVDRTCQVGAALGHPLAAVTSARRPAERALLIADATSALCVEPIARDAELDAAVAAFVHTGPARVAAVRDARERERRARATAALRFHSAWERADALWGPLGVADGACPEVPEKDELALLVGLVSGALAMLHDKASGGTVGVPLDTLVRAGRAADCLDDTRWWHAPAALQAAGWAVVPGSGPADVDAWQALEDAARAGEGSGVRLGWALAAQIAGNAGQDARTEAAIRGFTASQAATPADPEIALFDRYSLEIVRHQSDLIWAAHAGHRTEVLGVLPSDSVLAPAPSDVDPFADPFRPSPDGADDPFAEPSPVEPP